MKIVTPLRAIKLHCIECMGGVKYDVKGCTSPKCNLYIYRMGRNPYRKGGPGGDMTKARAALKKSSISQVKSG